jgi:hypothetical protein
VVILIFSLFPSTVWSSTPQPQQPRHRRKQLAVRLVVALLDDGCSECLGVLHQQNVVAGKGMNLPLLATITDSTGCTAEMHILPAAMV